MLCLCVLLQFRFCSAFHTLCTCTAECRSHVGIFLGCLRAIKYSNAYGRALFPSYDSSHSFIPVHVSRPICAVAAALCTHVRSSKKHCSSVPQCLQHAPSSFFILLSRWSTKRKRNVECVRNQFFAHINIGHRGKQEQRE